MSYSSVENTVENTVSESVWAAIEQKKQLMQAFTRSGIYKLLDLIDPSASSSPSTTWLRIRHRYSSYSSIQLVGVEDSDSDESDDRTSGRNVIFCWVWRLCSSFLTYVLNVFRQQRQDEELNSRISKLVSLNGSLVPEVGELLQDSVSRPHERATTPHGVPYYIK